MIQLKRGTTHSWKNTKIKLAAGQPGYDKNRHKIKVGDGESLWSELPYASGLASQEVLDSNESAIKRVETDPDDLTIFTYGTAAPDENTVGQIYLQHYEAAPEVDYVISAGINNGWTYQKWNSGIATCCGTFELKTPIQLALGNDLLYQSNNELKPINYPFTFKKVPSESVTVQSPGSLVWIAAAKGLNTKSESATYSLISPDKTINTAIYTITLKVDGFWK